MKNTPWIAIALASISLGSIGELRADEPFFYYPAYGAQRGKIVYRDGPRRDRQVIRWGNGLTPAGASVLNNLITTAGPIVGGVINREMTEDEKRAIEERETRHRAAVAEDESLQQRAGALKGRTEALAKSFGISVAAPAPDFTPAGDDTFSDWDPTQGSPSGWAPGNGSTPGNGSAPAGGAEDKFEDWDNKVGSAPIGGAGGGEADNFADWDNRPA